MHALFAPCSLMSLKQKLPEILSFVCAFSEKELMYRVMPIGCGKLARSPTIFIETVLRE